ncbi:MAG: lysophospholipid acyltransferase family protein [Nitrospirota bacterium]
MRARMLSLIGWALISLWSRTLRIRIEGKDIPRRIEAEGKTVIFAFWHGRQFLLVPTHKDSGVVIPVSESRDGEIQAGILTRFGLGVVRGSSKRKGARALMGLVDALRNGKSIAISVDGPRGPIYEVKQGITYLAGKLGLPIVPVITSARRAWILEKIWDKYLLPKPFSECIVLYGEPVIVNGTEEDELEKKRLELGAALTAAMDRADQMIGRAGTASGV